MREVTNRTNQPTEEENVSSSEEGTEIRSRSEIVGIDPGTTTAVATLDISGNIVETKSERHMAFEDISRFLIERGKPIVVAADKAKVPSLVEKTAATFGALAYSPRTDLGQEEKKELISNFDVSLDSHTEDALAAAYHAWENYRNLIFKVKKRVKENKLSGRFDNVLDQVVKQSKPIKTTIRDVQRRKNEKIEGEQEEDIGGKKTQRDKQWWRQKAQDLALKLDQAETKIENLEEYNQQIKEERQTLKENLKELKSEKNEQRKRVIKEEEVQRRTELVRRKNKEIERLQEKLEKERNKIERLKQIIDGLKQGWLPVAIINSAQELAKVKESAILLEPQIKKKDIERVAISKQVETVILANDRDEEQKIVNELESKGTKVIREEDINLIRQARTCIVDPQTLESEKKELFSWIKRYKRDRAQSG